MKIERSVSRVEEEIGHRILSGLDLTHFCEGNARENPFSESNQRRYISNSECERVFSFFSYQLAGGLIIKTCPELFLFVHSSLK